MSKDEEVVMERYPKAVPFGRWALTLAFMLAGVLALVASSAPAAWAGPAQEEYRLQIPDPRGGGGSSSPGDARSELSGGGSGSAPSGGSAGTSYYSPASGSGGAGSTGSGFPDFGGDGGSGSSADGAGADEALLAKARQSDPGSGLLAATTSAMGKTPAGLAVVGALLLIALAGAVAVRRARRSSAPGAWD
jgi:hypothetical protein